MTLYKKHNLWLHHFPDIEGQMAYWGQCPEGKGDVIFRTCMKIVNDGDRSNWAYQAITQCCYLVEHGKRWPDECNHDKDAANLIDFWSATFLYKIGVFSHRLYRPQTSMTRDPYIALIYALVWEGAPLSQVKKLSIPWWLHRPTTWVWHRYLKTGKQWRLKLFRLLDAKKPSRHQYVNVLRDARRKAIEMQTRCVHCGREQLTEEEYKRIMSSK